MFRPGSQLFWGPLSGCCAPFLSAASGLGGQRSVQPLHGCGAPFSLRGERLRQPDAWRPPLARCAFSLRDLSTHHRAGLRKSLDRNRGLLAVWEGVASLGLSLPLSPPPDSYLQRGWGGSSLEFLSPFVLRTAGGVFRPVNFSSLSHSLKKAPSDCSQGLLSVLTLSNAAGSSPFRPLLLVAGAGVWGTFLLEVAFRHIICGPYLISTPS